MKNRILSLLKQTMDELVQEGFVPGYELNTINITTPPNKDFGDFASNIAMTMAARAKKPPRDIANAVKVKMEALGDIIDRIDIAGPGFINFYIKPVVWTSVLNEIHDQKELYGTSSLGAGKKVQVEFVSANPTGPLHIGHGRGAAVGDTLVRILAAAGFDVEAEYYINDVGNQMNNLGLSVLSRYRELFGEKITFPDQGYKGEYIKDLATALSKIHGEDLLRQNQSKAVEICREFASRSILEEIKSDLDTFNVSFDRFFSESTLYENNEVDIMLEYMKDQGLSYEDDGALWFRTSRFGDEKDRVLRKNDGTLTYFAPDIAYHKDKLARGFTQIIDIWGADHHGYVPRMKAAIEALGADKDCFNALLIQLVSLVRQGKPVQMSTRSGEFITLKEIIDEVGKDVARYFFLMRRCDSQLVFDLDLAKKKSDENPVYYIQYAHARICSILANASEQGMYADMETADFELLATGEDLELIKVIATYPDVVAGCAADLEPHRIAFYLLDLATAFHRFYNKNRVLSDDGRMTKARLVLISAVKQVLANALALMGIEAPQSM
ncbi:MAG TPA: arginine--tRNA ligase [Deltaproteobacteria bacterium]|nr:arginine--tRNA ligase [Deltaproteobacteria bacterium]